MDSGAAGGSESFRALDLQPDGAILVLNIVMDTDLALEVGLVVKDVIIIAQRKDRLLGLPHEFFDVLQQFAETLPHVH